MAGFLRDQIGGKELNKSFDIRFRPGADIVRASISNPACAGAFERKRDRRGLGAGKSCDFIAAPFGLDELSGSP